MCRHGFRGCGVAVRGSVRRGVWVATWCLFKDMQGSSGVHFWLLWFLCEQELGRERERESSGERERVKESGEGLCTISELVGSSSSSLVEACADLGVAALLWCSVVEIWSWGSHRSGIQR